MKKNNITEMVFILDRSGSMCNLVSSTVEGFNSMIEKQKKEEGRAIVTTVLFDHRYEILHEGVDIEKIDIMTSKEYFARGRTALLDAIGFTINKIDNKIKKLPEGYKPSNVIFVIITDGNENESSEFSKPQIKQMIEEKQSKEDWAFVFLGADIDVENESSLLGIDPRCAKNYSHTKAGTQSVYDSLSKGLSYMRNEKNMDLDNMKVNLSAILDEVE